MKIVFEQTNIPSHMPPQITSDVKNQCEKANQIKDSSIVTDPEQLFTISQAV